jgi:hypothetical protein
MIGKVWNVYRPTQFSMLIQNTASVFLEGTGLLHEIPRKCVKLCSGNRILPISMTGQCFSGRIHIPSCSP